jgi:hypothetical protein
MYSQSRILAVAVAFLLPGSAYRMAATTSPARPQVMDAYGKLPLSFEANQGQTDPRVKFLSRGAGYTLFLTQDSAVLALRAKDKTQATNAVLRMKLQGANAHASVAGAQPLPGKSNYFVGNHPNQWRTNVPTFGAVTYAGVYPGIDLVYHGNQRLLEYDFVVSPGADPRTIDLRFQGARKLSVNREGALVIGLGGNEVIEHAPVVYQQIGGVRKTLAGKYVLRGRGRVGFGVAEYDRSRALVIDPVLAYSTYLGGSGPDTSAGIALDASGNAYVSGSTRSSDFPISSGAFQTALASGTYYNTFVSKLNASGSALLYSTYLGGSGGDYGVGGAGGDYATSVAADASGNAYVTGVTYSSDFPTTSGAFQTSIVAHGPNAFVSKLNAAGSSLLYSTYLSQSGQVGHSQGGGIAVDASGNAYVTGTASADFPTTPGAFQTTFGGGEINAFVSKLNAAGSGLLYSTYLGGSSYDVGGGIAIDASRNAYVTGYTLSSDFPTTPGAFQTASGGGIDYPYDAFVSKLNATGSALLYSTYLGGSNADVGAGIAVDASGNAYVTGGTYSTDFPTTPGAFQTTLDGNIDCFVSKLNPTGSALVYSTYLGGTGFDQGSGIAIDASGNAFVIGDTDSSNFPTTPGAVQTTYSSDGNAFVTTLNTIGSALLYSTYLRNSYSYEAGGIAADGSGNVYVTGYTWDSEFPTTPGAFQTTFRGGEYDAFVIKLGLGTVAGAPVTTASFNGPAGNNGWYLGSVTVTLNATAGKSPISATYYSVDGGAYKGYGAPFPISGDGIHQLLYYSVDTAGNQETPHGRTIKIDSTPPVSHVAPLPPTELSPSFTVQWSGTDATSGVHDFTIFVSDNGGPFASWLVQTTATQSTYTGVVGHTYGFYSIAQDVAGNQEGPKTTAEATTTIVKPPLPVSHVTALPSTEPVANFIVQWSGTDAGGPGIRSFTIYVSDNVGAFTAWQNATTATQAWWAGTAGHTYGFYSIALDLAGNQENPKTRAEATTRVASVVPGDVNGDGQVNCLDIDAVKASFGKKTGQPGFNPNADVNKDGVVNVLDLALVSRKLIPGTTCQ